MWTAVLRDMWRMDVPSEKEKQMQTENGPRNGPWRDALRFSFSFICLDCKYQPIFLYEIRLSHRRLYKPLRVQVGVFPWNPNFAIIFLCLTLYLTLIWLLKQNNSWVIDKQRKLMSHSCAGWEVQGQGTGRFVWCLMRDACFLIESCNLTWQEQKVSFCLFYKGINCIHEPFWLNHLP